VNRTQNPTRISSLWVAARQDRAERRARATARRRLASEIADYTSQTDRNDLNALLDTYPDTQVAEIRDLLNRDVAA
jgi:hypothetical protein